MTATVMTMLAVVSIIPHAVKLENASPPVAIAVWFGALLTRAIVVALAIAWLVLYLPATQLFTIATHWCWHTAIPRLAMHLGLDGHTVGDLATILPLVIVCLSLASVAYGMARAGRAVRKFIRSARLGNGPRESIIVREPRVLLAVTGIARPRVVVSDGALGQLDKEELAAGLEHENGHIGRHHQRLLVAAELFRAFARFLPGTNCAMRELVFHTERDADEWALRRNHDASVLASAICKAALSPAGFAPALGGGQTTRRVKLLLGDDPLRRSGDFVARALAVGLAVVAIGSLASVPTVLASVPDGYADTALPYDC